LALRFPLQYLVCLIVALTCWLRPGTGVAATRLDKSPLGTACVYECQNNE